MLLQRTVLPFIASPLMTAWGLPSQADWTALSTTLSGRLHRAEPFSRPCFAKYNGEAVEVDEDACAKIRSNYTTNAVRRETFGAYMNLQSEICYSDPADGCLLNSTAIPAAPPDPSRSCNQGSVPDYYVAVQQASDVQVVFAFARSHAVPLSIKNSGHDYMTRNSQKASLALWVHRLKGLTHHQDFTPDGCDSSVGRAITVAAGETMHDVYVFASAHGSTAVGGYGPDIAMSGGWVQGGGHGVLSPALGLGVDRVVQFRLVTPDGAVRVANACQNPDLFRALRGGGGGTFGVVLDATHRVEPAMPIAVASLTLPGNSSVETVRAWIELQVRESLRWGREGWGGHVAGTYLTHMNPLPAIANLSDGGSAAAASMRVAADFVRGAGGNCTVEVLPDWLDVWEKYVLPGALRSSGVMRILGNRLVPRRLFATEEGIQTILRYVDGLRYMGFDLSRFYVPAGTPFVANATSNNHVVSARGGGGDYGTSVNPAWYSTLWTMGGGANNLAWDGSYEEWLEILIKGTKVQRMGEELFGKDGGAYVNEANPFTQDWREAWWGENYDFLLEVKKKYDPDGLLKCWKCVGFEDDDISSDRFRCHGRMQRDIDLAFV